MTALERLFSSRMSAWIVHHDAELAEFERRMKSRIQALAAHHRRSLGQRFRWAEYRLRGNQ